MEKVTNIEYRREVGELEVRTDCGGAVVRLDTTGSVAACVYGLRMLAKLLEDGARKRAEADRAVDRQPTETAPKDAE